MEPGGRNRASEPRRLPAPMLGIPGLRLGTVMSHDRWARMVRSLRSGGKSASTEIAPPAATPPLADAESVAAHGGVTCLHVSAGTHEPLSGDSPRIAKHRWRYTCEAAGS